MTWAFGKAILFGEHAVVYGHPALAGGIARIERLERLAETAGASLPVDRLTDPRIDAPGGCPLRCRLTLHADRRPGIRLRIAAWGIDVAIGQPGDAGGARGRDDSEEHVVARALRTLVQAQGAEDLGADIDVYTELPPAAGLGSSAAMAVALVRTLARDEAISLERTAELADLAERCFHDNPSGVDVALASRGGLGIYRRGQGMTVIDAPPVTVCIGLSGEPRRTSDMVVRVARARDRDRAAADDRLSALGDAALAGRDALVAGDLAEVGRLMNPAHERLAWFGISTPGLDDLVGRARDAGALGAKLTGAGGGGAVIAVAPGRESEVIDAWRGRGYRGFVCQVGAMGPGTGAPGGRGPETGGRSMAPGAREETS